MDNGKTYYLRARHRGTLFGPSAWGPVSYFQTKFSDLISPEVINPPMGTQTLASSQVFTASSFVQDTGTISIPKLNALGEIIGQINADYTSSHQSTDWQLSTSSDFSVITQSATTGQGVFTWNVTGLLADTDYYVRARFNVNYSRPDSADENNTVTYRQEAETSDWGPASVYGTLANFGPNTPSLTAPANGATNQYTNVTISTTAFSSNIQGDTHESSDWEVSTNSTFTNVVKSSYNNTVNKTSWVATGLAASTTYYCRARHKNASGGYSDWAAYRSFTTMASFAPNTPSVINPYQSQQFEIDFWSALYVSCSASAFVGKGGDTHYSSDWQISKNSSFTSLVSSVRNSTANKTSYQHYDPYEDGVRYLRVRYKGASGLYSAWSPTRTFYRYSPSGGA